MKRPYPTWLRVLKVIYWGAVVAVPVVLLVLIKERAGVLFNQMTVMLYGIAATAVYQLLLLIARFFSDNPAVESEIEESEGRTELHLTDRDT